MLKDPTVKVDNYDGSTPIDTHLGKFNITARCCQWTPEKRLYFLTQSLVGKAADITANLPATADEAYVVDKLKQFYRGKHQANRHEAEMKSRQRKKGETILSLFQDISRLKDLAFPGQTNDQIEKICLEAFLEALCDETFKQRILDRGATSLEMAADIAEKIESYGPKKGSSATAVPEEDSKKREARVAVVSVAPPDVHSQDVKRLQDELAEQRREMRQRQQDSDNRERQREADAAKRAKEVEAEMSLMKSQLQRQSAPAYPPNAAYAYPQPYQQQQWTGPSNYGTNDPNVMNSQYPPERDDSQRLSAAERGGGYRGGGGGRGGGGAGRGRGRVANDTCIICGKVGCWSNICPERKERRNQSGPSTPASNTDKTSAPASTVNSVNCGSSSCVYLKFNFADVRGFALCDTGCDRSIISHKLVAKAVLEPCSVTVSSASNEPINCVGKTRLHFCVDNQPFSADVLVSDNVEGFILGNNFLSAVDASIESRSGKIRMNGKWVQLHTRPGKDAVRRIYVREEVTIPANFGMNVPVNMPVANTRLPCSDWLVEPKSVGKGLVMARTLVSGESQSRAVPMVNLSGQEIRLREGQLIAEACSDAAWSPDMQSDSLKAKPQQQSSYGTGPSVARVGAMTVRDPGDNVQGKGKQTLSPHARSFEPGTCVNAPRYACSAKESESCYMNVCENSLINFKTHQPLKASVQQGESEINFVAQAIQTQGVSVNEGGKIRGCIKGTASECKGSSQDLCEPKIVTNSMHVHFRDKVHECDNGGAIVAPALLIHSSEEATMINFGSAHEPRTDAVSAHAQQAAPLFARQARESGDYWPGLAAATCFESAATPGQSVNFRPADDHQRDVMTNYCSEIGHAHEKALDLSVNFRPGAESPGSARSPAVASGPAMTNICSAAEEIFGQSENFGPGEIDALDQSENFRPGNCTAAMSCPAVTYICPEGSCVVSTNQDEGLATAAAGRDASELVSVVVRQPSCAVVKCDFCDESRIRSVAVDTPCRVGLHRQRSSRASAPSGPDLPELSDRPSRPVSSRV